MVVAIAAVATTAISAGASAYGASQQASAAKSAAKTQAEAAMSAAQLQLESDREGRQLQLRMLNRLRQDQAPWQAAGRQALGQLRQGIAPGGQFRRPFDFEADPGYAFRVAEGQRALENSASARGMQLSGAQGRALTRYGQDFASNEYNTAWNRFEVDRTNRYNRLAGISGTGQVSANQVGQAGVTTGANIAALSGAAAGRAGEFYTQAGNARASGYIGAANAYSNMASGIASSLNSGLNTYLTLSQINRQQGGTPYSSGPNPYATSIYNPYS